MIYLNQPDTAFTTLTTLQAKVAINAIFRSMNRDYHINKITLCEENGKRHRLADIHVVRLQHHVHPVDRHQFYIRIYYLGLQIQRYIHACAVRYVVRWTVLGQVIGMDRLNVICGRPVKE